jgi:hypothetical protein
LQDYKALRPLFRLENWTSPAYADALMVPTCFMPMTDAELRQQLEARDTIFFLGGEVSLQKIERQVEQLGFGELYTVSATWRLHTGATKIKLRPLVASVKPQKESAVRCSPR